MKFLYFFIIVLFIVSACFGAAILSRIFYPKFKQVDAVLFSEMSGVITYNGEPAEGAVLNLSVSWNDSEKITREFHTNSKGEFSIPKIEGKIETSPLVELVISQSIQARYKGKSYDFWIRSKRDTKEYSETDGKPKNFRCDLSDPLRRVEVENGLLGTPCNWELAG